MRQFDVFVFEEDSPSFDKWTPVFEDPALGWFHSKDWNSDLEKLEAEWIIFTTPDVKVDREFLNELAQEADGYTLIDAFAPRIKSNSHFYGGLILDGNRGFKQIDENAPMRYVAGPNPLIGVFSRRIIQRTGIFDQSLPPRLRLLDYALRMAHAGGKMFSVPYLVAEQVEGSSGNPVFDGKESIKDQWDIIYKNLFPKELMGFTMRHPSTVPLWFKTKELDIKRNKATDLSKLSPKHLLNISSAAKIK